jgi:hypothetical protein
VTVLVAGANCGAVAEQASKVSKVSKVILSQDAGFEKGLAENITTAVLASIKSGGVAFLNTFHHIDFFLSLSRRQFYCVI